MPRLPPTSSLTINSNLHDLARRARRDLDQPREAVSLEDLARRHAIDGADAAIVDEHVACPGQPAHAALKGRVGPVLLPAAAPDLAHGPGVRIHRELDRPAVAHGVLHLRIGRGRATVAVVEAEDRARPRERAVVLVVLPFEPALRAEQPFRPGLAPVGRGAEDPVERAACPVDADHAVLVPHRGDDPPGIRVMGEPVDVAPVAGIGIAAMHPVGGAAAIAHPARIQQVEQAVLVRHRAVSRELDDHVADHPRCLGLAVGLLLLEGKSVDLADLHAAREDIARRQLDDGVVEHPGRHRDRAFGRRLPLPSPFRVPLGHLVAQQVDLADPSVGDIEDVAVGEPAHVAHRLVDAVVPGDPAAAVDRDDETEIVMMFGGGRMADVEQHRPGLAPVGHAGLHLDGREAVGQRRRGEGERRRRGDAASLRILGRHRNGAGLAGANADHRHAVPGFRRIAGPSPPFAARSRHLDERPRRRIGGELDDRGERNARVGVGRDCRTGCELHAVPPSTGLPARSARSS